MQIYKKEFKDIWLKAAVLGSLWGSIEIIIGSFFHNIRLPMAGTILAVLGISLITAFGQTWKDKGLFWRAGLICAVMKSVSPSAILIGPMTGILFEALLFELAVFLFGRNILGYVLGAVFALYSVVIHKVMALIIIYGFDLVRITENFYFFIIKQLNIESISFIQAFFTMSSIYILLGLIASAVGIIIGKKAVISRQAYINNAEITLSKNKDVVSPGGNNSSLIMLFAHLIFIILVLTLTNMFSLALAFGLTLVYSIFAIIKYKRPLRYFKRPWFWIQIFLFIVISALFYDGFNKETYFTSEGIAAGLKMGVRAVLIVIGFSAVSSELRNPLIKVLLYRRGFWQFYIALSLAFSVLPHLIKNSARPKKILKSPLKFLVGNIYDAEIILEEFKKKKICTEVIIITGKKQGGKTTYVQSLIKILQNKGYTVKGFSAKGKFKDNVHSEFYISDIQTDESIMICNTEGTEDQKRIGRFYFNEEGLNFGKNILKPEKLGQTDFVVIDEIGPFELKGRGWTESIEKLLEHDDYKMIWVVREKLVYDILRRFGITKGIIVDIKKYLPEDIIDELTKFMHP